MTHWTEEFFVENAAVYAERLAALDGFAPAEVEGTLARLAETFDHEPATVLDVGCGLGRHALAFAREGLDVTGIDVVPTFLDRARERAADAGLAEATRFRERDMRELDGMDRTFDLVTCLYNTLGYFDDETNRAVVAGMRDRLADDGVCVVQLTNKDATLREWSGERVRETERGLLVERRTFDSPTSRMRMTWDVLRGEPPDRDHVAQTEYDVRLYAPPEIERLFRDAGFDRVELYGGYDGGPPSVAAGSMLVCGR